MLLYLRCTVLFALLPAMAMSIGCSGFQRSVARLETPQFYLHTYYSPHELKDILHSKGCSVECPEQSDMILVSGVGTLTLPSVIVEIRERSINVNGDELKSRPEGYRNVTVSKDGQQVYSDTFIKFER